MHFPPVGYMWLFVSQIISDLAFGNSQTGSCVYRSIFFSFLVLIFMVVVIYAWVEGTWEISILFLQFLLNL